MQSRQAENRQVHAEHVRAAFIRARAGFAQTDLIILVACVALVAVVALPRHVLIDRSTKQQAVSMLAASVRSSTDLAHALWEQQGQPSAVELHQGPVAMVNGYPSLGSLPLVISNPEARHFGYAAGRWQHLDVNPSAPCGVEYQSPLKPEEPASITMHLDGC